MLQAVLCLVLMSDFLCLCVIVGPNYYVPRMLLAMLHLCMTVLRVIFCVVGMHIQSTPDEIKVISFV